jgi:hypothetical protein
MTHSAEDSNHPDSALLEVVAPMKGCPRRTVHRSRCALDEVVLEGAARATRARVDSPNGCHHFQWWFRARTGNAFVPAHPDSARLEVVAPMKGCRSRAVHRSRCALDEVVLEGAARATRARVDSPNGCHHFQWWFRARTGNAFVPATPTPHYSKQWHPSKAVASGSFSASRCRARRPGVSSPA